jgi:hypothetical protein
MQLPLSGKLWIGGMFIAVVASVLFWLQGGFAGGAGRFDLVLVALGFPWALIPWPESLGLHDFVWLIAIPLVMNLTLGTVMGRCFGGRHR